MVMSEFQSLNFKKNDRWIIFMMDENDSFEWNPSIMDEKWTFMLSNDLSYIN